jgi:hypothetical protein
MSFSLNSFAGMRINCFIPSFLMFSSFSLQAQDKKDSVMVFDGKVITLSEVIVRRNTDVPGFIDRVKKDSTFYKAFRNLRVLNFTSLNDIRMFNKQNRQKASLWSRTRNLAWEGCRHTEILEDTSTGDFYDKRGNYNYYTAELYASLFFAFDTVCGETNIVKGEEHSIQGKSGIEKHKEQLKMLFFNPGQKIPGIPFMGNKVAVFDQDISRLYDFSIDIQERMNRMCYVFRLTPRKDLTNGERDNMVINEMTTWFDYTTFEVLARSYDMSYSAGIYNFDVQMEVQMTKVGEFLVPNLIRYTGNWGVLFKKKEKGVFTATLFDFKQ